MESLLKPCENCHKPMNGGIYRASHICPHCLYEHAGGKVRRHKKNHISQINNADTTVPATCETPDIEAPNNFEEVAEHVHQEEAYQVEHYEEEQYEEERVEDKVVPMAEFVLTKSSAKDYDIIEELGQLHSDCSLHIELTPALFENGKFIGARSEKVKAALLQGKKHALIELKQKALSLGANIVSNVEVKNTVKAAEGKKAQITVKASGYAAIAAGSTESCAV